MRVPTGRTEIVVPIRTIVVLAGVFFLGWAIVSVREALLLVFTGIFLALVFERPVRAVQRRLHVSRGLAATIVILSALLVSTGLALVFLVPLVEGVRDLLQDLPAIVADLRASGELSFLGDSGAAEEVENGARTVSANVPDAVAAVLGVAGKAFSVFIAVFTVTFTALFFLTDVANLKSAAATVMSPGQEARWLGVWDRVTDTVSRWAVGVLVIALMAGFTQGMTAWLLGSSYALALGLIAGVLDTIPNLGATIAGFVLSLVLLAEEGLTAAIVMVVVVLVYQQVENNLITPTVQGRATNISGFFVITGVTVFGALLGVLGALIAVPVTATIQILVQEITAARREAMGALRAPATAAGPGGPPPPGPPGV